jgi:glutaredoxin
MRLLPILLAILAVTAADAASYRWVDPATGKVMFTDTPPPGNAKAVSQGKESTASAKEELPYATRKAAESFPVILYTAPNCIDDCKKARELLSKRKIPFTEKSVQKEEDLHELKVLVDDTVVPVIKVGRQTLKGFDATGYNNMLDLAGYPGALRPAEKTDSK